jgi:hypothetical protein
MANTMTLIASYTVGSSGVSSIDFSSIPQTYTDLVLYSSMRSAGTSTLAALLRFNGSSTSGSEKELNTGGSTVGSSTDTNQYGGYAVFSTYTANTFANNFLYIPNYTASINKLSNLDWVMENNATANQMTLSANLWANTSAINQITLVANGSNNFVQYSTAYLYGIKNS